MHGWQSSQNKLLRFEATDSKEESQLAATCLQIVDASLIGVLFLAPLFFGGRHPLGQLVFISLASVASIAWCIRQTLLNQPKWTHSWANLLAIAAILLVALQLLPLPLQWLQQLAPRNIGLLPLWTNESGNLGHWQTLSLAPSSTRIALATLIAYSLLFVTTAGRLQKLADIECLIQRIALAAILMSVFGILQYFFSNGHFFWVYEHPHTTTTNAAKGSFTCQNHFAHFLVLGLSPLLAWIDLRLPGRNHKKFNDQKSEKSLATTHFLALLAGLVVLTLAVLLSSSRGAAVAFGVACTTTIIIFWRKKLLSSTYLYGLIMLGLLIVGILSLSGYEQVASRFDDFATGSIDELDRSAGRRKIWAANVAAIREGSLFGSGAGSHREIYPVYLPQSLTEEYTHAENGYLQIATENGLLGLGLLILMIGMISMWCWRAVRHASSNRSAILSGAVTASLVASATHSAVDFVWFIPSCMSLTILLAACALRLAKLTEKENSPPLPVSSWLRSRWIGLTTTATCSAVWAIATMLGPASASIHWDRYLLTSVVNKHESHRQLVTAKPQASAANDQLSRTEAMVYHLRNTLARNPQSARAHLRLAGKYYLQFNQLQQFSDNAMSVDEIRNAAIASQFTSAKSLQQWLSRAFGENSQLLYRAYYHAHKALQLCPLQGEGYLYLANLCFLEGKSQETIGAYVQQSIKVRPYDGDVLFEAGRQLQILKQPEKTVALWKKVYPNRGIHQLKITEALAGPMHVPAIHFVDFFEPTWNTLRYAWKSYRRHGTENDREVLLRYAESAAQQECPDKPANQAARIWHTLALMQGELEQHENSLRSMQKAYAMAPSNYSVRRDLGRILLLAKQYRKAEPHLKWCLARKSDDAWLQNALVQATKSRLGNTRSSSLNSRHK